MVALDMEQPWSEAIGRAIINPINLVAPAVRYAKGAAIETAAYNFVNSPADEVFAIYREFGDDLIGIKTATESILVQDVGGQAVRVAGKTFEGAGAAAGEAVGNVVEGTYATTNLVDKLLPAYNSASSRVMSGINASQSSFGPFANTGVSKIHLSTKLSTSVLQGLGVNIKNADDIADVVLNLAKLQSSDPEQQRAAMLMLHEQLQVPHLVTTEPAIETSILLSEFLKDADGVIQPDKLVTDMKLAIKEGADPLRVAINRAELAASDIYPTERAIIDAERALKADPDAKIPPAVQRFFDNGGKLGFVDRFNALRSEKGFTLGGVYGAIHRAQKAVSSTVYVGANLPVATRGALYDTVMSGVILSPNIYLHSADYWADVATDILGYEHSGLTQTFGHEEASGMASWKANTGSYKDRGRLLERLQTLVRECLSKLRRTLVVALCNTQNKRTQ